MYELNLRHHFSAAHQLVNAFDSNCNDYLHGHNWIVYVTIQTDELYNSMVVDFKQIKQVINKLDHRNLNDILDFETTAENLSKYIHDEIVNLNTIPRVFDVKIKLYEGEHASITYTNPRYD